MSTPPASPLPTYGASPLAAFTARVCHTLWHGAASLLTINTDVANARVDEPSSSSATSPRVLYHATPPAFIHLVHRTLHPHHSPHMAATALLYIQRYLTALHPPHGTHAPLRPAPGSEARIWCTALQVTVKQHDDRAAASRLWQGSRIEELAGGGLSVPEMVAMEREFLRQISWRLGVAEDEYKGWVQRLARFKAVMETLPAQAAPAAAPAMQHLPVPMPHFGVRRGSAQSMASTAELTEDRSEDEFDDDDEDLDEEEMEMEEEHRVPMPTYAKEHGRKRSVTVDPRLLRGARAWLAAQED